jgi:hypothetical protein
MIAPEIVTAAEQDDLLPMDPFDCPLTPTGRRVSRHQLKHVAKAPQPKHEHVLRWELRGQKPREMFERYRKNLAIHQIVATCKISENPSISLF